MTPAALQLALCRFHRLLAAVDPGFRDLPPVTLETTPRGPAFARVDTKTGCIQFYEGTLAEVEGNDPFTSPVVLAVLLHEYLHVVDAAANPPALSFFCHRPAFDIGQYVLFNRTIRCLRLPLDFFLPWCAQLLAIIEKVRPALVPSTESERALSAAVAFNSPLQPPPVAVRPRDVALFFEGCAMTTTMAVLSRAAVTDPPPRPAPCTIVSSRAGLRFTVTLAPTPAGRVRLAPIEPWGEWLTEAAEMPLVPTEWLT